MHETESIQAIVSRLRRHPSQVNRVFESDAEIIPIGTELWAITCDDFSAEEDRFQTSSWADLGWNLAVATISDLLAVGAEPAFFLQALSLPRKHGPEILEGLTGGLDDALRHANAYLLGGDFGSAATWRFCGTALGRLVSPPLTRCLAPIPQELWVTGELGDIAISTLLSTDMPRLELRLHESRILRRHASACIDTSSGFFQALWDLLRISPPCQITIERERLPLAATTRSILPSRGIAPEAALLAGAGEYELLFTIPGAAAPACRQTLEQNHCTRVGSIQAARDSGVTIRQAAGRDIDMPGPPPDPRIVEDIASHAEQVIELARSLFP